MSDRPLERRGGMIELEESVTTLRVQFAVLQATIEEHIEAERDRHLEHVAAETKRHQELASQVGELLKVRQQTEGAVKLLKVLAVVISTGSGALLWVASHWPALAP